MNTQWIKGALSIAAVGILAGCSTAPSLMGQAQFDQSQLPAAVQVPAGHKMVLETVGVGQITYECKAAADGKVAWTFAGPEAKLIERNNKQVGRYFGPPATWAHTDGSAITGTQLAVAPGGDGNIPMQLVKANPATGQGMMTGVTYVQRIRTRGGVAPALPCGTGNVGARSVVNYQADYLFYKAA